MASTSLTTQSLHGYQTYLEALYKSIPKGFKNQKFDDEQIAVLVLAYRAKAYAKSIGCLDGVSFMASTALQRILLEIVIDALSIAFFDVAEQPLGRRYLEYEGFEAFKEKVFDASYCCREELLDKSRSVIEVFESEKEVILSFIENRDKQKTLTESVIQLKTVLAQDVEGVIPLLKTMQGIVKAKALQSWRPEALNTARQIELLSTSDPLFRQYALLTLNIGHTCVHSSTRCVLFFDSQRECFHFEEDQESGVVLDSAFFLLHLLTRALHQKKLLLDERFAFLEELIHSTWTTKSTPERF